MDSSSGGGLEKGDNFVFTLGRYSFLLVTIFGVLIAAVAAWKMTRSPIWLRAGIPLVVALGFFLLWLVIRPTATTGAGTPADAASLIGDGTPTVLEFYSEY